MFCVVLYSAIYGSADIFWSIQIMCFMLLSSIFAYFSAFTTSVPSFILIFALLPHFSHTVVLRKVMTCESQGEDSEEADAALAPHIQHQLH